MVQIYNEQDNVSSVNPIAQGTILRQEGTYLDVKLDKGGYVLIFKEGTYKLRQNGQAVTYRVKCLEKIEQELTVRFQDIFNP